MRRLVWFLLALGLGYAAWSARARIVPAAAPPIAAPPAQAPAATGTAAPARPAPGRALPTAEIDEESRRELDEILREADREENGKGRRR